MDFVDDDFDSVCGVLWGFGLAAAGVVGADHDYGDFWVEGFWECAVLESPDDVLGLVSADAEVEGVVLGEVVFPKLSAGSLPCLGDGVTDED